MQTKHLCFLVPVCTKVEVDAVKSVLASSKIFLLTVPMRYFFCGSIVLFVSCVSNAFVSVHCCLVVTCCSLLLLVMFIVFLLLSEVVSCVRWST